MKREAILGDAVVHKPTGRMGVVTRLARYVYGSPEALLSYRGDGGGAEWVGLASLRVIGDGGPMSGAEFVGEVQRRPDRPQPQAVGAGGS